MKAKNRRMSIDKWDRVMKYVENNDFAKADVLAQSQTRCGHCREYTVKKKIFNSLIENCGKCPLYNKRADRCHSYVIRVVEDLGSAARWGIDRNELRELKKSILRVQTLVRTR